MKPTSRLPIILPALVVLALVAGCGGSGSMPAEETLGAAPTATLRVTGTAVLPTTTAATLTAALRTDVVYAGLAARLESAAGLDLLPTVSLASDGSFAFQGVPAGSAYRLAITTRTGRVLLYAGLPDISTDLDRVVVDPTSTALFILTTAAAGRKTAAEIQAGLTEGRIDLKPLMDAVAAWLGGSTGTGGSDDVAIGVTATVGNAALDELVRNGVVASESGVVLLAPTSGSSFPAGTSVVLTAQFSGRLNVRRIQFYSDGTRLGETGQGPFAFLWVNPPVGTHTLTAKATFTDLSEKTSAGVQVFVQPFANSLPAQPVLTSPASGAIEIPANPTLQATAFSDPNTGDLHVKSDWEVYSQSQPATGALAWSSSANSRDRTSILLDAAHGTFTGSLATQTALPYGGKFWARVRYYDLSGDPGPWSALSPFATRDFRIPGILGSRAYGGSQNEFLSNRSLLPLADGGFLLGGLTYSADGDLPYGLGNGDIHLMRVDAAGNPLWSFAYGGTGVEFLSQVIQTSDGGFLFVGSTNSNDFFVQGNHGNYDIWVGKVDQDGNPQWGGCFGGSAYDSGSCVWENPDGSFSIAGFILSQDGDVTVKLGLFGTWLFTIDSTGKLLSQSLFDAELPTFLNDVQRASDGSLFFAGRVTTFSSLNGKVTPLDGDVFVTKVLPNGQTAWRRFLSGTGDDLAQRLILTPDGGCLITGSTTSNDGDFPGTKGARDLLVAKLSQGGTVEWKKTYGGTADDGGYDLLPARDGTVLVGGFSRTTDGDLTGSAGNGFNWLLWLDERGNLLSQKRFGGLLGEGIFALARGPDQSVVLGCTTGANNLGDVGLNHGGFDYWLVKLEPGM